MDGFRVNGIIPAIETSTTIDEGIATMGGGMTTVNAGRAMIETVTTTAIHAAESFMSPRLTDTVGTSIWV